MHNFKHQNFQIDFCCCQKYIPQTNTCIVVFYACCKVCRNEDNNFFACPVFLRFRNFNEVTQYIIKQVVYVAIESEVKVVIKRSEIRSSQKKTRYLKHINQRGR